MPCKSPLSTAIIPASTSQRVPNPQLGRIVRNGGRIIHGGVKGVNLSTMGSIASGLSRNKRGGPIVAPSSPSPVVAPSFTYTTWGAASMWRWLSFLLAPQSAPDPSSALTRPPNLTRTIVRGSRRGALRQVAAPPAPPAVVELLLTEALMLRLPVFIYLSLCQLPAALRSLVLPSPGAGAPVRSSFITTTSSSMVLAGTSAEATEGSVEDEEELHTSALNTLESKREVGSGRGNHGAVPAMEAPKLRSQLSVTEVAAGILARRTRRQLLPGDGAAAVTNRGAPGNADYYCMRARKAGDVQTISSPPPPAGKRAGAELEGEDERAVAAGAVVRGGTNNSSRSPSPVSSQRSTTGSEPQGLQTPPSSASVTRKVTPVAAPAPPAQAPPQGATRALPGADDGTASNFGTKADGLAWLRDATAVSAVLKQRGWFENSQSEDTLALLWETSPLSSQDVTVQSDAEVAPITTTHLEGSGLYYYCPRTGGVPRTTTNSIGSKQSSFSAYTPPSTYHTDANRSLAAACSLEGNRNVSRPAIGALQVGGSSKGLPLGLGLRPGFGQHGCSSAAADKPMIPTATARTAAPGRSMASVKTAGEPSTVMYVSSPLTLGLKQPPLLSAQPQQQLGEQQASHPTLPPRSGSGGGGFSLFSSTSSASCTMKKATVEQPTVTPSKPSAGVYTTSADGLPLWWQTETPAASEGSCVCGKCGETSVRKGWRNGVGANVSPPNALSNTDRPPLPPGMMPPPRAYSSQGGNSLYSNHTTTAPSPVPMMRAQHSSHSFSYAPLQQAQAFSHQQQQQMVQPTVWYGNSGEYYCATQHVSTAAGHVQPGGYQSQHYSNASAMQSHAYNAPTYTLGDALTPYSPTVFAPPEVKAAQHWAAHSSSGVQEQNPRSSTATSDSTAAERTTGESRDFTAPPKRSLLSDFIESALEVSGPSVADLERHGSSCSLGEEGSEVVAGGDSGDQMVVRKDGQGKHSPQLSVTPSSFTPVRATSTAASRSKKCDAGGEQGGIESSFAVHMRRLQFIQQQLEEGHDEDEKDVGEASDTPSLDLLFTSPTAERATTTTTTAASTPVAIGGVTLQNYPSSPSNIAATVSASAAVTPSQPPGLGLDLLSPHHRLILNTPPTVESKRTMLVRYTAADTSSNSGSGSGNQTKGRHIALDAALQDVSVDSNSSGHERKKVMTVSSENEDDKCSSNNNSALRPPLPPTPLSLMVSPTSSDKENAVTVPLAALPVRLGLGRRSMYERKRLSGELSAIPTAIDGSSIRDSENVDNKAGSHDTSAVTGIWTSVLKKTADTLKNWS